MIEVVTNKTKDINPLEDVIRKGVREMLRVTAEYEVKHYINAYKSELDKNGHRVVVRNGYAKPRKITTSVGNIEVKAPRVNDKRPNRKFISKLLPPYLRSSNKVESLIPALYLQGLSTGKISHTLKEYFQGEGSMGLSPSSVSKLLHAFTKEFEAFKRKKIDKKYAYLWADGVNVKSRLSNDRKVCLLVVIGVSEDGSKELLAVQEGYRESKEAWSSVLRSLVSRGLQSPLLAIADGALGFWSALEDIEECKNTIQQKCWVHKIGNVLNKLPKRVQVEAKTLLHEMMKAPDKESAVMAKKNFTKIFNDKYPKATECLEKDWKQLTSFFNYPAKHWASLRTTNPIESAFATIKLRTKSTKGSGSSKMAAALAFKLLQEAEKRWNKIRGSEEVENIIQGVEYRDGVMVQSSASKNEVVA